MGNTPQSSIWFQWFKPCGNYCVNLALNAVLQGQAPVRPGAVLIEMSIMYIFKVHKGALCLSLLPNPASSSLP